jgi:hypothetical protein
MDPDSRPFFDDIALVPVKIGKQNPARKKFALLHFGFVIIPP